ADDGARRLVVDVEVARGEAQRLGGLGDRCAILCDHGARQAVRRALVDVLQDPLELAVLVDVHGEQRAEVFGREDLVARVAAEHFCPWYSNAPRTSAVRSTSTSALEWATTKSLPPVSPTTRG